MKNKWLVAFLSVLMAVSLCFGVVACKKDKGNDDDNDLENVSYMIDSLNDMYADESELTPVTYTVTHSILVSGKQQPVEWSVTAVTEGITLSDFVVVGATDEAKNETTIEIKQTSQVVDYKLTATVTVGKATDSVTYERQIPHVYTVAGIEEFGANIASGSYYEEDGVKTPFIVSGYVVKRGTFNTNYKNWNDVYIADTAEAAAEYPTAMQVYRLEADGEVLKEDGDLLVGAKILVHGWLQNYNGKLQLTHDASAPSEKSGNNPTAIQITPPELSDQEKVDLAKGMLTLPKTVYGKAGESVDLETSISGAAVTWAVTSGEGATITGSTLKIASPLPSTPQKVVLTATIKAGAVTDTKTFTIQVGLSRTAPSTQENPYSVAEALEFATTIANLDYSGRVFVKGYVVNKGTFSSSSWSKVYIADAAGESDKTKQFYVFAMSTNEVLTQESDLVVGDQVILSGFIQNYNGTYELTYNNKAEDENKNVYCVSTSNKNAGQGGQEEPEEPTKIFTVMETPTAGSYVYSAMKGDVRYYASSLTLDGGDEGYIQTSSNQSAAVEFTLELKPETTDKWYIKLGEKYLEIYPYANGTKTSYKLKLVTSPTAEWEWMETERCFKQAALQVAESNPTTNYFYIGTYNDSKYTTLSPSNITYIQGSNAANLDVSQHPGRFGTLEEPTDADKANAVLNSVSKLGQTTFTEVDETGYELPTENEYEADIVWSVKSGNDDNLVEITNNTLKIKALPESGSVTITLAVSVTVGEETVTKEDIEITVKKEAELSPDLHNITATYDPTKRGHSGSQNTETDKLKDISIKIDKVGSATAPNWGTSEVRVYGGDTITISVPENYYLTKITLHYTRSDGNAVTVDVGTLGAWASNKAEWTGTEGTVVFTVGNKSDGSLGGHIKLTSIEFEYKSPTAECTHETVTKTDAIEAECEKPGQEAYWTCESCNRMFSSETEKTDENEIFVPVVTSALGHSYTQWQDNNDGATHTATCDNCHTETSTEAHDKLGEGGKCSKCGGEMSAKMKDVVLKLTASALGFNSSSYTNNNGEHTVDDFVFTTNQAYANSTNIQMQKGNGKGSISNKTAFPGRIKSIVVVFTASQASGTIKLDLGTTAALGTSKSLTTASGGTQTFTADEGTDFRFFKLYDPTQTAYIVSITITYETLDTAPAAAANAQLAAPVADLPRKD